MNTNYFSLNNSIFINNAATNNGGGICIWGGTNYTITNCIFTGNTVSWNGGGIYWACTNSTMFNCNFTNNKAYNGDNVYWRWNVNDFLNKYHQIMIMIMFLFIMVLEPLPTILF